MLINRSFFLFSGQINIIKLEQYEASLIWIAAGLIAFSFLISVLYLLKIRISTKTIKRKTVQPVSNIIGKGSKQLQSLNKDLEPYGFKYEMYQDLFYSVNDCWQRKFGYCRLYDEACAPISLIVDCEPIRFEYKGYKWLIEFWKGQYGMTSGGEVGIYHTNGADLSIPGLFDGTLYNSVPDKGRINMAFTLKKNGLLLFTRSGFHWWLTGFKLGEFSNPSELSMDIILELYDTEMCKAFVEALQNVGYKQDEFSVSGRRVHIQFDKPHTPQPISRTAFTELIMQRNNELWCNTYENLTKKYTDTLEKLQYLKLKSPRLYSKALSLGKSPLAFEPFHKIDQFINMTEDKKEV